MPVPRLRVIAGPNGSGKSTIIKLLPPRLIYTYVNADDLEKEGHSGSINLEPFGSGFTHSAFHQFYVSHALIIKAGLEADIEHISISDNVLTVGPLDLNSYHTAVLADFIRHKLLERSESFTFETVMSDSSKIEFIKKANDLGYRTYLYYVTTESSTINEKRVENRVEKGGHNVDPAKIRSRYIRCLDLLPHAILASNRAYLFDNSGDEAELEAKVTDSREVQFMINEVHNWCLDAIQEVSALVEHQDSRSSE